MSIRRLILVFATVLFLVPGVLGAADVPGVTDTEVAIGCTTPLSGPAALWGTTGMGMKAWADYINDKGGIHGRKIKFVMKDDAYNPTRGPANLQEMKGNVLAVCGGTWNGYSQCVQGFLRGKQDSPDYCIRRCPNLGTDAQGQAQVCFHSLP